MGKKLKNWLNFAKYKEAWTGNIDISTLTISSLFIMSESDTSPISLFQMNSLSQILQTNVDGCGMGLCLDNSDFSRNWKKNGRNWHLTCKSRIRRHFSVNPYWNHGASHKWLKHCSFQTFNEFVQVLFLLSGVMRTNFRFEAKVNLIFVHISDEYFSTEHKIFEDLTKKRKTQ